MIKIGYIVSSLNYGGVEKYVVDLANNIDRSGFDPVIFSLSSHIPLSSQLNSNTRIHTFERKKGNDPGLWLQLSKKISQEKIDVLHSNNWSTYLETVAAKLLSLRPRLIHVQHGMEANDEQTQRRRFAKNRLRQACTFFTDQVAVVSEATKSFVQTEWYTPPDKIHLIHNGVNTDFFKPGSGKQIDHFKEKLGVTNTACIIGSVGRLMKVKNYAMLIKAFSMIVSKNPDTRLVLVGDGPEKKSLQHLVQNLGIENKIIFAGTTSDVRSFLQIMDIFVLPSFSEGVSLSLLEAMAAGCPAVATAVGGNKEVINPFQNGLLVPSDNPAAMAHALENLINDQLLYQRLRENSRKTVIRKFSLKQMIYHYQQLYRKLHRT